MFLLGMDVYGRHDNKDAKNAGACVFLFHHKHQRPKPFVEFIVFYNSYHSVEIAPGHR
jgi:hypothetical protein